MLAFEERLDSNMGFLRILPNHLPAVMTVADSVKAVIAASVTLAAGH